MMMRAEVRLLIRKIRNCSVPHARRLLPYGVILTIVSGMAFLWDGPLLEKKTVIGESEMREASPAPFSYAGTEEKRSQEKKEKSDGNGAAKETEKTGKLIFTTLPSLRHRPLPDLFAAAPDPTEEAAVQTLPAAVQEGAQKGTKASAPPVILGYMAQGARQVVLLSDGTLTAACRAGDHFGSYTVSYITDGIVGLTKGGETIELYR